MANPLQHISNYFIGTEVHEDYKQDRDLYREIYKDPKELKREIRKSKINEGIDLFLMKAVPNAIDIASIAHAIISKSPPYGLALGELWRNMLTLRYHVFRENEKTSREGTGEDIELGKEISPIKRQELSDKL